MTRFHTFPQADIPSHFCRTVHCNDCSLTVGQNEVTLKNGSINIFFWVEWHLPQICSHPSTRHGHSKRRRNILISNAFLCTQIIKSNHHCNHNYDTPLFTLFHATLATRAKLVSTLLYPRCLVDNWHKDDRDAERKCFGRSATAIGWLFSLACSWLVGTNV